MGRGWWEAGLGWAEPSVLLQALNEEKVAYDRSPSKNIYLNVAVNTLKKLRGLGPGTGPGLNSKSPPEDRGPALPGPPAGCQTKALRAGHPVARLLSGWRWAHALRTASSCC